MSKQGKRKKKGKFRCQNQLKIGALLFGLVKGNACYVLTKKLLRQYFSFAQVRKIMTKRVVPRKKNFHRYHHMFGKYKYPTRNMTEERSLTDEVQQLHIVTPLTAQMFQ